MALIITGHPRSGTTLLQKICDSHPDIQVTHEFGCFRTLGVPISLYCLGVLGRCWATRSRPILTQPDVSHFSNLLRCYKLEARFLAQIYRSHSPLVTVSNVESALRHLFPNARIVGDKLPDYVFNLNQFVELDNVSVVVIYRDCRDVTASYLEKLHNGWGSVPVFGAFDTPQKIAENWLSAIQSMTRYQHQVCIIRYEDLIKRPECEFKKLGQCLDVDPAGFPKELVRDSSIGSYKHRLSADDLSAVMRIAGHKLADLGYE
ncbi:MAG TPA: sulfotransferase [Thermodesulfobacteriota bacterium]|nr:sulfotransferase [Thermodesulfobacteriota bacterium]